MKKDKRVIWVIMHYEFIGLTESAFIDSVQFHASSSLKRAEKYIRSTGVASHSWWQVHPHVLDAEGDDMINEGDEVYYYSHRGTQLKSAPISRARISFDKYTARYPEFYSSPRSNKA